MLLAQGLTARDVGTLVLEERLPVVFTPLVFEASVYRAVRRSLCITAVLAALELLEVGPLNVRCCDAHVWPHARGGVPRGVIGFLPRWHRYLWVDEGKPKLVEVVVRGPYSRNWRRRGRRIPVLCFLCH